MKDWTGIEIGKAHQRLEHASALTLGRILFEFSRLDMALGLLLVWSDGGKQLEKLTKELEDFTFHKKLDLLAKLGEAKYASDREVRALYAQWLTDTHFTRRMRNELVHGRWGIDPIKDQVINVIGLPTSPNQRATSYTIAELEHALNQIAQLQRRLAELRTRWPV